jgi:hypothetical protein
MGDVEWIDLARDIWLAVVRKVMKVRDFLSM